MLPFHPAFSRWRVVSLEQVGTILSPSPLPWEVARGSRESSPLHVTVLPPRGPVQWGKPLPRSLVAVPGQSKAVAPLEADSLWEL